MKTFKDLTFKPHHRGEGKQAVLQFDNGQGIIAITKDKFFYTSGERLYNVALISEDGVSDFVYLSRNSMSVNLIPDDVDSDGQGHCTAEDVTRIMEAIQKL